MPTQEDKIKAAKLQEALSKLTLLDMVLIHSSLGEEMQNIIEERFDDSRDARGAKFKKIKRYFYRGTAGAGKRGTLRRPSDPPLKVLDLYKSFSYDAAAEQVVVGTPKYYAKFHTDFATNNGGARKAIPLREFMGVETDDDIQRLLDVVEEGIDTLLPASTAGVV